MPGCLSKRLLPVGLVGVGEALIVLLLNGNAIGREDREDVLEEGLQGVWLILDIGESDRIILVDLVGVGLPEHQRMGDEAGIEKCLLLQGHPTTQDLKEGHGLTDPGDLNLLEEWGEVRVAATVVDKALEGGLLPTLMLVGVAGDALDVAEVDVLAIQITLLQGEPDPSSCSSLIHQLR